MIDAVYLFRVGINTAHLVFQDGIVFPATFQQFVKDFHEIITTLIAIVVIDLLLQSHRTCGAVQVTGHNIPADAAIAQMIERGQAAGEQVRLFVSQVAGHAKAQMPGGLRHQRHHVQRIIDRQLHRFTRGRFYTVTQDVIHANDIRQEHTIEQTAFQQLRQLGPVFRLGVITGVIAWMLPQTVMYVADTIHIESIQAYLLAHS
ncbi:hypothetical protein D3C81_1463910 [compost metagenome]